jgi:hypothetical protein
MPIPHLLRNANARFVDHSSQVVHFGGNLVGGRISLKKCTTFVAYYFKGWLLHCK